MYVPPEERTDHEQGETLSGVSVLLKNNNSLSSAKSTIFDLFRGGFSILFKAACLKPTHSGNLPSHCGMEEGGACAQAFANEAFSFQPQMCSLGTGDLHP